MPNASLCYSAIMNSHFTALSGITARPINGNDWESYRDYYTALPDPAHYTALLEDKDIESPGTWHRFFEETEADGHVLFGLFNNGNMIGQTAILFDEDTSGKTEATLVGSEINPAFRGRGLSDHLYDVRMRYLADSGFIGSIKAHIRPDNAPSANAAIRNGFIATQTTEIEGYDAYVYDG